MSQARFVAVRDAVDVVSTCLNFFNDFELVSIRAVVADARAKAPYLPQSDEELAEIASIQAVSRGMNIISFDGKVPD